MTQSLLTKKLEDKLIDFGFIKNSTYTNII